MFRHGQQLYVRVAKLLDVGDEGCGQLPVCQPTVAVLRYPAPGAKMYLVCADGCLKPVALFAII
ncbi:hypothetical protein MBAV_000080 [Candidatus Magnetobacterium bavaricum]|uniref:Uncharacterized protein n=1 Tax=Candidatus Magnetobacterium bavaricum TaxID=29290 RepID=A0A0F3H0I1_9BACT|nr:hypothetical protein MBAV_000080 [Candidatus Magnetobacterium bavaricum]